MTPTHRILGRFFSYSLKLQANALRVVLIAPIFSTVHITEIYWTNSNYNAIVVMDFYEGYALFWYSRAGDPTTAMICRSEDLALSVVVP